MFDYINFKDKQYQTKDTPQQSMDTYEIRGDELWWRKVDYEWVKEKNSFSEFAGYLKEVSHEWLFCEKFDGVIDFYRQDADNGGWEKGAWIEYHALFNNGKMIKLERKNESLG
jgi:hypothetical protein